MVGPGARAGDKTGLWTCSIPASRHRDSSISQSVSTDTAYFLELSPAPASREDCKFTARCHSRVQGHPGQLSEALPQNKK